ncbi:DUF5331 domain-containing protein [Calothrix sp. 336/3]|uniref:DUF5331 domain-containing protein n=1 Tax=Calothrix sp. 336/3 TaxID=1337936 RepID=UPI0004E40B94|nr:DUF5331 domain-containing protein [Calothrix sp. 336/3]AKG23479.1 hypothetical protein IJ00_21325 [Calothrix sp. 336/3]
MAFFYSFTDSIKQKWLQFFQSNRDWIKLHMQVESVYTPDGGKRPSSYLILGVVNALEPKLAQLMLPFSKLNQDADTLVEVLDLHFDPDIALGNRNFPESDAEETETASAPEAALNQPQSNEFTNNGVNDTEAGFDHEETLMVPDTALRDELRAMSFEEKTPSNGVKTVEGFGDNAAHPSENLNTVDEFGDISFSNVKDDNTDITAAVTTEEHDFGDVMSDVWGDESVAAKAGMDSELFGEDLSNGAFDDSEIASLFPNS